MPAYLLIEGTITDRDRWTDYRNTVVPLIARFGGKHLTRGGGVERLEGGRDRWTIALFEFSSMEAIHEFWNSPEYGPVRTMRQGAAKLDIWAVPGA